MVERKGKMKQRKRKENKRRMRKAGGKRERVIEARQKAGKGKREE